MEATPQPSRSSRLRTLGLGCGVGVLAAALSVGVSYGIWTWRADQARQAALAQQEKEAEEAFDPVLEKMKSAEPAYDIDKTIRVIHEVDNQLTKAQSMDEYLKWAARQDYEGVAPEVLEERKALLQTLMKLYAKQAESEDEQAMWDFSKELVLSTLSVVDVSGEASMINPVGKVSVDRAQAQALLEELKARQSDKRQLQKDISGLQQELFTELMDYSDVYYRYVREWDELSVLRDRAYLAAHNGDWPAAIAAADLAIQKAPKEREAHLIKAMALIEQNGAENDGEILALLGDYIQDHPESSAPALVLLGVQHARQGRQGEAQLAFQQSATYFPKQADRLTDMVDPYKMRSFLGKTREGNFIVELYQSTMLGAGYFSPDLQMAKTLFDQGKDDEARQKVLDHFARRRNQKQWDFILSDIRFCQDLLGPDFWQIFPETTWLDLEVSPATFSSALNLSVKNRSARTLHNATLILAVHFTEMYPDDYVAVPVPLTVPAVLANDDTSFGSITLDVDVNGTKKGLDDVVHHRAILITNEAVTWVDTDAFKIAESDEFRERKRMAKATAAAGKPAVTHPLAARHPEFQSTVDKLVSGASAEAQLAVESKYGKDTVMVTLPKELSILRPIFRLSYGGQTFTATDNVIEGDKITLRFPSVDNFDGADAKPASDIELLMGSPFGDLVMAWKPDGALTWRFAGSKRE